MKRTTKALSIAVAAWVVGYAAGKLLRSDPVALASEDSAARAIGDEKGLKRGGVAEAMARWSKMSAPELVTEYLSASDRNESSFATILLEKLAEIDIDAALAAEPDGLGFKSGIFRVWARTDPDAAEAEARKLIHEDPDLALTVAVELVESHPERALRLARDASIQGSDLDSLFSRWAHTDHSAATEAAMALALEIEEEVDGDYLDGIVDELTHRDPSLTLAWAESLPKQWQEHVRGEFAERWVWYDHRDVMRALDAGLITDSKFADLLAQQILHVAPERLSLGEAQGLFSRYDGTGYALDELSSTFSGREMATIIDLKPNLEGDYDDEVAAAAADWAKEDPRAAAEWAARLNKELNPEWAVCEVCKVWLETEPTAALDLLTAHASLFDDGDYAWAALDGLIDAGLEIGDALDSVSRFTPDHQAEIAVGLVGKLAAEDPLAAAEYAIGLADADALVSLADGWYAGAEAEEMPAIGEWFYSHATAPGALDGLEYVADAWTDSDVGEASSWVAGLEAGPARDVAVRELVEDLRGVDPEAAHRWAASLGEFVKQTEPVGQTAYDPPEIDTELFGDSSVEWAEDTFSKWSGSVKFRGDRFVYFPKPAQSRSELVEQTLAEWFEFDPQAAAAFVAEQGS